MRFVRAARLVTMGRSSRRPWLVLVLTLAIVAIASARADAHPVPFSYIDLRLGPDGVAMSLVVHVFDVAHDLGIEPMERLLDPAEAATRSAAIAALLASRVGVTIDGQAASGEWSPVEPLPDRQALRFRVTFPGRSAPGVVTLRADAFPYDPDHRTFLNIYDGGELARQEILDHRRPDVEYFTGSRQGVLAVIQRFVPSGVHHILIGPDHLLFLVGLLLSGGTWRRLLLIVSAFTLAHSVTLSLAALGAVVPPAWMIEPAIALSIVYVGLDNLLRGQGRDMRAWIAFGFGFIHGFGFANVLRDMGLPSRALGWSLASFNVGVEIGQVAVVAVVAVALHALRARFPGLTRAGLVAGSIVVIAAGAYWFVQRTFFPGG